MTRMLSPMLGARRIRPWRLLAHVGICLGAVLMMYPLLWMISSSLKPSQLIFSDLSLWPSSITFKNYQEGWDGAGRPFSAFLVNSGIIAAVSIIGNLLSCSLAAYALARIDFRGRRIWFALMLCTIMLPFHVTVVPQYLLFLQLDWVNTFFPMIVPKFLAVDAFFVFLLVQFIRSLPRDLDDAARLDGASHWQIYRHIILPLCLPALVTVAIFTFIWTWNDFFTHLIYLSDQSRFTVPLGLRLFLDVTSESEWGQMFAMTTVSLLPVLAIFLIFQRYLVEGIATTGSK